MFDPHEATWVYPDRGLNVTWVRVKHAYCQSRCKLVSNTG